MSIKIIGAGFGRTGTLSLKKALEIIGFRKCYHMLEVSENQKHFNFWNEAFNGNDVDWKKFFKGYKATIDWPSSIFWKEQLKAFPGAKVILTHRDTHVWYDSIVKSICPIKEGNLYSEVPDDNSSMMSVLQDNLIWNSIFDRRMGDRNHVIDCYNRHFNEVIDYVPAHSLLIHRPEDGWEMLCRFLDKPLPGIGYPFENKRSDFIRQYK